MRIYFPLIVFPVTVILIGFYGIKIQAVDEKSAEYWTEIAEDELNLALKLQNLKIQKAKNVIFFIGDGMGISTMTAGRILKGQLKGQRGEDNKLAMDKLPHLALSKTYTLNKQVPDSAATVTAMLSGVKANHKTLGLSGRASIADCASQKGNEVQSVLVDSYQKGKSTGIVTTTYINHATPAGAFAHSADRAWLTDDQLPPGAVAEGCKDIAQQFYDSSDMITVALGGGRKFFRDRNYYDEEYPQSESKKGARKDGQNLIAKWQEAGTGKDKRSYVWNKRDFNALNPSDVDRLLGLFEPGDMKFESDRHKDEEGEPSLTEMTKKAIEILQKNENGFFLLVEGGKIDHAHHSNNAYRALHELVAFDDAIEQAVAMTSQDDTLIIVSADHSHVFTVGGNSVRGNSIFGLAPSDDSPELLADGKPYTTLLYANGKSYQGMDAYRNLTRGQIKIERQDLSLVRTFDDNYRQQSAVPRSTETHGGEDVAILASGPMAHLFHGVHEQNYIAHVIRYASCVGNIKTYCDKEQLKPIFQKLNASTDIIKTERKSEAKSSIKINYLGSSLSSPSAERTLKTQFVFLILLSLIIFALLIYIFYGSFNCKSNEVRKYRWP